MLNSQRIALCLAAILALSPSANAEPLNPNQTSNLYLVGKVWGYLKYHHRTITSGCIDWDEKLLRDIPAMLHATDGDQVAKALEAWIDELTATDWNVFIEGPPHGKSKPEHVLKSI